MFQENLSAFFNVLGHGVPVVAGSQSSVGILEMPDQIIADGHMLSTDYALWYKTASLTLAAGATITVSGVSYKVRDTKLQDDGAVSVAALSKV